jgi:two-component system NtrC family sensor kinase
MPRPSANPPQRIAPPRTEGLVRRPTPTGPDSPAGAADFTLSADAYRLQSHLERLTAEFDLLRRQLRQAQKMASVGTNAAMIAHEFNNLFTPVVAYAQQALDTGDVALMKKALAKTVERCGTMRHMADRLSGLAKQSDSAVKNIRVLDLVQAAVECLGRDPEKDNIAVNLQIDPHLAVRASENELMQVLFNLVINARQAMLGRGRGRLTIDAAPAQEGGVEIHVRDNGCGIPSENLSRIFKPFFSTKQNADRPDKRGLGLGLSICREIIEELDGRISVTSEVNVGTTFTIALPAAE